MWGKVDMVKFDFMDVLFICMVVEIIWEWMDLMDVFINNVGIM